MVPYADVGKRLVHHPLNNAAFLSFLGLPRAICRGVTTDTALRCSGAHFRHSQGSLVSPISLSLSLPHLFLFFPLDSDKFRELHTEKATAVLNIVLNTVMPNVHIWASFRYVATRISFPRYEIIFISFTNLMYPRGRRRVSRPNWRQSLHY